MRGRTRRKMCGGAAWPAAVLLIVVGQGWGRGVSDGARPPVGGRFRQPDRIPFFWLTQAFGLRSIRKNGYVLTGRS